MKDEDASHRPEAELGAILARCDAATPGPWISSFEVREHYFEDSFMGKLDER
jgi:hypothetical protein